MASRFFRVALFLIAALSIAVSVSAQNSETASAPADQSEITKEKLDAIEKEIESLRSQSNRLAAQEDSIIATLNQYDVETQIQTHEMELLDLKQKQMQADIDQLQNQFQELQKNLERQKAYLTRRLVEAYKQGELNYVKLLLRVNSAADLLRSYQYVTYLAKDDSRKLQQYRDSIQEMEQTRLRLEQENRNLAQLKQDSEEAYKALLLNRQEKVRLLAAIQDQREMHLSALSDLKAAAGQLQDFFANVEPASPDVLAAGSILQFKGFLDWPARGKVIREFGLYKHPRFGTTTMSNGIEIAAQEGADVRAVFTGEVVFSEWFKGYGQCIILSHPQGFYTLYGHNSELLVHRGDTVQRGQLVARVGSTGALNGPGLYFEIRRKDQPMNPSDWLRKSLAAR